MKTIKQKILASYLLTFVFILSASAAEQAGVGISDTAEKSTLEKVHKDKPPYSPYGKTPTSIPMSMRFTMPGCWRSRHRAGLPMMSNVLV
jgi:hypothetical protein